MPRVLVVTYPWLPAFSGGVKFLATIGRYLPEAGWDPIILTRDWSDGAGAEDAALGLEFELGELPPSLRAAQALPVVRTPYGPRDNRGTRWRESLERADDEERPARGRRLAQGVLEATYPLYGAYPDAFRGWEEHAVPAGVGAVRQYGAGAVLSVSAPASAHIAGGEIARQAGVPWLPLFGSLDSFYLGEGDGRTRRRRMEHRVLARRWLRGATRAAAVSPAMTEYLRAEFGLDAETVVVPFDLEERRMPPRRAADAPLRAVHVGRLGDDLAAVDLLADAIDRLLERDAAIATRLRVELVGTTRDQEIGARLAGRAASRVVILAPRVPPADALRLQREADLLLSLGTGAAAGAARPYAYTLFELLNARRPIVRVATGPDGYVEQLLRDTRAGTTATSASELADRLARALEELARAGELAYEGEESVVAQYGGAEQARRLAALLDGASAGRFGSWQRG